MDKLIGRISSNQGQLSGRLSISKTSQSEKDYEKLTNKPKINNVAVSGNKSGEDYGLQNLLTFDDSPSVGSVNPVKSNGVYQAITAAKSEAMSQTDIEKILYMDV